MYLHIEIDVRVSQGTAETNSSFLNGYQTFKVHPQIDVHVNTTISMNQFFYNIATTSQLGTKTRFTCICDRLQSSTMHGEGKQRIPLPGLKYTTIK